MENSTLHTEKVAILSRLIKESSLTLEEALLLLKEEEEEVVQNPVQMQGWYGGGSTATPYTPYTFTVPMSGSGTITGNGFVTTTTTGNTYSTTVTASNAESPADLNN